MAFNATTVTLENGLRSLREVAAHEKQYLAQWDAMLAGNITALQGLDMLANLDRVLPQMDALVAPAGMAAYAQAQLGSATYNIATEYSAMRAALDAIRVWLRANIPANAITVTNGVAIGAVYTPAATAPLRTLVQSAAAAIA